MTRKVTEIKISRTSLVDQWLRLLLPMQGAGVQSLVQSLVRELDPSCRN